MPMSVETAKRIGRPPNYTPEIVDKLCRRIATSHDGLEDICASDDDLPGASTVYEWLAIYDEFAEKYARARESQTEVYVQDMVKIAKNVEEKNEAINKAKLQIDTLKWAASKLKPKKYGDATIIRGDKDNPIQVALGSAVDVAVQRRQALPVIDVIAERIDVTAPDTAPALIEISE